LIEFIEETAVVIESALIYRSEDFFEQAYLSSVVNIQEDQTIGFMLHYLYGHLNYRFGQINYHRRLLD
jgi:hypothetical protein